MGFNLGFKGLKYEGKKVSSVLPRISFVLFDAHIQRDFPTKIVRPVSFSPPSSEIHVQGNFLFLLGYFVSRMKHEVSPFALLPSTICRPSKYECLPVSMLEFKLLKPTGYVMNQQFNIQQLYALPTLYLCVLYLSENKQRLVPLTA